jgi:hypothetical protein
MGWLLSMFYDDQRYENDQEKVRNMRDRMLATHLVDVDDSGRFKMNNAVRLVAEKYLQLTNFAKWCSLHEKAVERYRAYVERDPWFQERVNYHQEQLDQAQTTAQ